jgi:hypothetical protein
MTDQPAVPQHAFTALARFVPLAGVAYAVLTMAGNLAIGEFPDASSPAAELSRYYATHGAAVRAGGQLMILAALCLGLFGVAAWARMRDAAGPPMVAGLVLVGTAVAVTADLSGGATYALLGSIGADNTVTPAALQAWQIGTGLGGAAAPCSCWACSPRACSAGPSRHGWPGRRSRSDSPNSPRSGLRLAAHAALGCRGRRRLVPPHPRPRTNSPRRSRRTPPAMTTPGGSTRLHAG